jgi:FKBP-type peptidyl-prolyl cis-trans isomerase (trigger factor)
MLSSTLMETTENTTAQEQQDKTYTNLKKLEDKRGEIEFSATIPLEIVEEHTSLELAHAAQDFEMPGFRKGKVPEHIVRERLDEMKLLENAAESALREAVREIMKDENLSIVGSPRLVITKIALKNPVEFKVRFAKYPEVTLPDYKKIGGDIANREDKVEVTEADVDEAVTRLLAMIALQKPELDTDKDKKPELTDEIVKSFGAFENVADFKTKLRENLGEDKKLQAKEARREEILREVVKHSKAEIPAMLIDEEYYAFEEERDEELKKAGLSLEEYLKQTKKDAKEFEKEQRSLIEERIKTSVVFREIQKQENIAPSEKEIQTNIAYLKLRYPDRSERWLRETAEAVIVQEKIFSVLGLPLAETAADPASRASTPADLDR